MQSPPAPILVGLLFDFPQADGGASFEEAVRLGLDEVTATGRLDRPAEFVTRLARGLPLGTAHDVTTAFGELDEEGVLLILGPSISDNGLIARPLADDRGIPCINYTGGERTRGEFMFHYQIGSLEEEPPLLARRLAERGLRSAAVIHDQSPVGRGYAESFEDARALHDLDTTGVAAISPLAEDVKPVVARLRETGPDALVYLGLGVTSRAVAVALADLGWSVPVLANSSLMFGYARPDWRDGWAGWEYLDGVADNNTMRQRLREKSKRAAAGPIGCAAYDMGRLVGEAIARAHHLTRAGLKEGLERVKQLPATSGVEGTTMGFGHYDHAALKGQYLVLREWRDGKTVQVAT
ncbi:MAG TPA: ABC transporter substrate-binding protein [Acidimicrobiia bacterium]|jgi:branched-chain amino acid transport system substrate-binding protein|nr:ABC transporter substrate-binding protein [Acidimicrobiia bacterium]